MLPESDSHIGAEITLLGDAPAPLSDYRYICGREGVP